MTTPNPNAPEIGPASEPSEPPAPAAVVPVRELCGLALTTVAGAGSLVTLGFLTNLLVVALVIGIGLTGAGVMLMRHEVQ